MLHNIGKYSDAFQRRLAGSPEQVSTEQVDHSTAGAHEALEFYTAKTGLLLGSDTYEF